MKPSIHARNSARKHGGRPGDYADIHEWFDQTKAHVADMRHRAVLHNSFGIYLCAQVFGRTRQNADGQTYDVRDIGEDHVLEDLGRIPSLHECLAGLKLSDVLGAKQRKRYLISYRDIDRERPNQGDAT
jgi:hypothetical protein